MIPPHIEPPWSLVQYVEHGAPRRRLGVLAQGKIYRRPGALPDVDLMGLLADWDTWVPVLRDLTVDELEAVSAAQLIAPLTYPRKVLCAGANFYDHAEEMGTARPDPEAEPFFFLKAPSTTIVGPDVVVGLPAAPSQIDYEVELGVVVGRTLRDATLGDAAEAVAGYVVADDLSDRGRFPRPDAVAAPFGFDWLAHKSQDGFCPIGPGLVPHWLVPDVDDLSMTLSINATVKQNSSTAQMVLGVAGLLAAASRLTTLEPGDLVLTGTPAGVGMPRQDFLRDGDEVTVSIGGIGTIRHTLMARTA